jgi:hypothetical protein
VAESPESGPGPSGADSGARSEAEDAEWVDSFLLTKPGKTYRVEATDEVREDAVREALAAAARALTDRVELESQVRERDGASPSGPPS